MIFASHARSLDPFHTLVHLQDELERALRQPRRRPDVRSSGRDASPPTSVIRDGDAVVVRIEVPGVAPEAIEVTTQGRTLTVRGKRELPTTEGAGHERPENERGEFSRSLELPAAYDLDRAEASCKHGLLTIRIPRRGEAKPRTISVQAA